MKIIILDKEETKVGIFYPGVHEVDDNTATALIKDKKAIACTEAKADKLNKAAIEAADKSAAEGKAKREAKLKQAKDDVAKTRAENIAAFKKDSPPPPTISDIPEKDKITKKDKKVSVKKTDKKKKG